MRLLSFSLLESLTVGERLSRTWVFFRKLHVFLWGKLHQEANSTLKRCACLQLQHREWSRMLHFYPLNGFEKVLFFSEQCICIFQVSLWSVVKCDSNVSFSEISAQCVLEWNPQAFDGSEYTHFQNNGLIFQSTPSERRGPLSASSNAFERFQESASP